MNTTRTGTTRIGIVGYGNLGRGVERAIALSPDLALAGVFTRRDPAAVETLGAQVRHIDDLPGLQGEIDVLVLCGGSRSDLPVQSPELAATWNIVDSFDTHAKIPEHFARVDAAAREGGRVAIISAGWDPGLFSINRLMAEAVIPAGNTHTFWGRGLSQGHSDALRRIDGVAGAVQYTIPLESAVDHARSGAEGALTPREQHLRECFVVLDEGADPERVREEIVTMPDYFEPYDTTVHFISAEELARDHSGMPHGGFVIRSGESSRGTRQIIEYRLALESNPEFTSSVLVAYARAAHRMHEAGERGAKTPFDVAPGLLSPKSAEALRAQLL